MTSCLEAALDLAARGFPVLPIHGITASGGCTCGSTKCRSPGKHPRTRRGSKDATVDPVQIERWYKKWPGSNVAVATGGEWRMLDVDPRNGGDATLAALEAEHGPLPETVKVLTGSGGWHYWFRVPKGSKNSCGTAGAGLDIKGDGGYCLVPPSSHVSGGYRWANSPNEIEIAPLPDWLAAPAENDRSTGARAEPGKGRRQAHIEVPDDILELIKAGQSAGFPSRSEAEWRVVCSLLESGVEERIIKAVMMNPENKISERIFEKGEKWFDGEIERARQWLEIIPGQFWAYMPQHNFYHRPSRQWWPAASVDANLRKIQVGFDAVKQKPILISASRWLDQHRRVEIVCWMPGQGEIIQDRFPERGGWIEKKGIHCLNTYRLPTIRLGDSTKAERWVALVKRVYPKDYEHLIRYFAHYVKKPDIKINHALVLGGKPRIGKDTILEPLKHAVGPWNFGDVSAKDLKSNNNDFVMSVILRVNETRDLGDVGKYDLYEHMKIYEAAPPDVIRCNEKHLRQYYVVNVCGVIYTTNHKTDGMYLPANDERHYVAWSDLNKEDIKDDEWTELWAWYKDGGFGHVAAYLHAYELAGFNPKAPPAKTPAFWEMVNAHRAPENTELSTVLDLLENPDAVTVEMLADQAYRTQMFSFEHWLVDRKNRRSIPHRLEDAGYPAVRNPDQKEGRWKIAGRNTTVYAKATLPESMRIEAARKVPPVKERDPGKRDLRMWE